MSQNSAKAKEASFEDCLKLLKGDSDEQRLVGLLLATKFVRGDNIEAVHTLFDAIGFQFINRLIKTGAPDQIGKGKDQRQSYLHLGLSILAAFCRVPELASADETIAKVPVLLATLASKQDEAAAEDCYECLLAIAASSEKGMQTLLAFRALHVVSSQLQNSSADAPWMLVALKLFHVIVIRQAADKQIAEYAHDLTYMILPVAQQLSYRQDVTKFEALSILYTLLVSDISTSIRALLDPACYSSWPAYVRDGVGQILHGRVAIEQKYLALELAESVVGLVGDRWLVGLMHLPPTQRGRTFPDRFFLVMVQTLRVETAVLLNEVARIAFDPGEGEKGQTSQAVELAAVEQRRLLKFFALLESIISVVSAQEEGVKQMDEATLQRTIIALDEVVGVVFELLEDAQANHQNQGDILLASIHFVSRYLAEAPAAHHKRCLNLLNFLLSVSAESNSRPFLAVQFMLPFLTQLTLDLDGCKALLACKGHSKVVAFLSWAVQRENDAKGSLVDVCDILLNLLTKKDKLADGVNVRDFVPVLPALVTWVGEGTTKMEIAMAASVCTCVLNLSSEDLLRNNTDLGPDGLHDVFHVMISNLEQCLKGKRGIDLADDEDLLEIALTGSAACIDCYPSFKQDLRAWMRHLTGNRHLSSIQEATTNLSLRQLLAMALND